MTRFASFFIAGLLATASCAHDDMTQPAGSDPATENYPPFLGVNIPTMTMVSRDLYYSDVTVGTGAAISTGTVISVTHTDWLANGTQVLTNVGKAPLQITVGHHDNVEGWDLGIVGMHVGGTRLLAVGSNLAYSVEGAGCNISPGQPRCTVPPNSTMVYKIQVVSSP